MPGFRSPVPGDTVSRGTDYNVYERVMRPRLVVDADGLIKLAKAGLIEALVRHADVVVAPEVWREGVGGGGQRGHDDALVVGGVADQMLVQVPRPAAARSLPETAARLGAGERTTWAL